MKKSEGEMVKARGWKGGITVEGEIEIEKTREVK